ncbi:MAG TPA: hypothetical protein VMD29_04140, partial [Terracidiphilus sp.]|nr:hypothetical protein [Terracidiphilus sp.]
AEPDEVAVFLYENGRMTGPATFSTIGMRIQNEQSGSSSLFAQPMAVEAVPIEGVGSREQGVGEDRGTEGPTDPGNRDKGQGTRDKEAARAARGMLETRIEGVLEGLRASYAPPDATVRQGHLALLKRWYYRPEAKRPGEIFFPAEDGTLPVKALLRGVGRVAAKSLTGAAAS